MNAKFFLKKNILWCTAQNCDNSFSTKNLTLLFYTSRSKKGKIIDGSTLTIFSYKCLLMLKFLITQTLNYINFKTLITKNFSNDDPKAQENFPGKWFFNNYGRDYEQALLG